MLNSQLYMDSIPIEYVIKQVTSKPSISRGDYATCLSNWMRYYDSSNIDVLYYDQLKKNPEQFLRNILKTLSLDENHQWPDELLGKKIKSGSLISNVKETKPSTKKKMPPVIQRLLSQVYLPKVLELAKI